MGPLDSSYENVPLVSAQWATIDVPVKRPLLSGRLTISSREYCCLRLTYADEASGESYVLTRGLPVADILRGPVIAAAFSSESEAINGHGYLRAMRNAGWSGPISRAVSLMGLAAADASARRRDVPVWRMTGWNAPPTALIAVAIGYTAIGESPGAADVAEAEAAVESGASLVKLMGGFDSPDQDIARAARLRQRLPADIDVALDVNGAWSPAVVKEQLRPLQDAGVRMLEDPYPYELATAPSFGPGRAIEFAMGEVLASPLEIRALLQDGCTDWLRLDATLLGGPDVFTAMCELAGRHGVGIMPHFWPEFHRHLLPPLSDADRQHLLEYTLPGAGGFGREKFVHGLPSPSASEPDHPGFGLKLDWDVIAQLAGDRCGRVDASCNELAFSRRPS